MGSRMTVEPVSRDCICPSWLRDDPDAPHCEACQTAYAIKFHGAVAGLREDFARGELHRMTDGERPL